MQQQQRETYLKLKYYPTDAEGECIINEIAPVRRNLCKFIIFVIFSIIFIAIPLLLVHWFPKLRRIFYYDYCSFEEATHVAVINYDDEISINQLTQDTVFLSETEKIKCPIFTNRYMKYTVADGKSVRAQLFDSKTRTRNVMSSQHKGLNAAQIDQLRRCYGKGTMIVEQPLPLIMLIKQLVRPLYLFFSSSIILVLIFQYSFMVFSRYYYISGLILLTTIITVGVSIYQMVQLNKKIFLMAYYEVPLHALREDKVIEISSLDVVPGDVVFLKKPIKIPFEGIILEGSALINECALTGESVPIVKKADLLQNYRSQKAKIDKTAYVYEGTTIIQVNSKKKMALFQSTRQEYGIPVCVTRTNFVTMKGQLIRIILFPKQQENVFQKQSGKFLLYLFCIAIITYCGMINYLTQVVPPQEIGLKLLDIIAITVPPILPICMTCGIIYAIQKLKDKSIFCIDESKVITGGVVGFSCFDKTGTLTEDFMDFESLIPAHGTKFYPAIRSNPNQKIDIEDLVKKESYMEHILNNMASNHSIIRLEETGELIGDPMEVKLLQFGEFSLNQSNADPEVIFSFESKRKQTGEVYRRFDFDSDVQRMSVVCKIPIGDKVENYVYAKGSPQIMQKIMEKSSVPANYEAKLKEYTSNGFRVLAIANKKAKQNIKEITREQAEANLLFAGFEVFENKLKPQTKAAIKQLKQAEIGVVMITGDNPLTGSNIGYKSGIADIKKKMLICDYQDKHFTKEEFILKQSEELNEITAKSSHEQLLEKQIIIESGLRPSEIYLRTRSQCIYVQNNNKIRVSVSQNQFMQKMINICQTTNYQLCVTGNAFNKLFEGTFDDLSSIKVKFLQCATIYARTKPNDKARIVMAYQHTGKTVSMCGDGANDCGALKQADIGLSLSQAEASISAPFTSQVANISSMVELIKECRAGLATNFSIFNIMASYSLVQYTTSIITQLFYSYPPDFDFVYWDLVCGFFFILVIGYTPTADKLTIQKPNNSLFCLTNICQIMIIFCIQLLGQVSMILAIMGPFNKEIDYENNGGFSVNKDKLFDTEMWVRSCPQTNILFLFSNLIYVFILVAFKIGRPWRKTFFRNIPFMIVLVLSLGYSSLIVIVPEARLAILEIDYMNSLKLNGFVLGMAWAFGIFIIVLNKFVMEPFALWIRNKYPQKKWL